MIKILFNGIDISQYCLNIDTVKYEVGEYGQLFTVDTYKITLNNIQGIFDPASKNSPFYGTENYNNHFIEVYVNGSLITEGYVYQIDADDSTKTSIITITPTNVLKLDNACIYASVQEYTPSVIVREICELYKIPVDQASFFGSNAIYEKDNIQVTAYFDGEMSIKEALQSIAEIGCARIYMYKGKLYYQVYKTYDSDIAYLYQFNDDSRNGQVNIWSQPTAGSINKQKINGYTIKYIDVIGNDQTLTFNTEADSNKSLSGANTDAVRIVGLQSATWIGETWLEYLSFTQKRVSFKCNANIGKSLDLYNIVEFNYNGNSNIYRVVGISTAELVSEITLENVF